MLGIVPTDNLARGGLPRMRGATEEMVQAEQAGFLRSIMEGLV